MKEMENLLHDYHLAQAMDFEAEHEDTAAVGAVDRVLEKYGIQQADLDSSLNYYAHHMRDLKKIYDNLNERYTREASTLGIHSKGVSSFSESGDTTDIWLDARLYALSTNQLNNMMTFHLDADTSFYQRDQFQIQGIAHFLGRPTPEDKNGMAFGITVVYDNDSIQSTSRTISASQEFMLDIRCDTLRDIKAIYGYMAVSTKSSHPLLIENIRLFKMHRRFLLKKDEDKQEDTAVTDSVEVLVDQEEKTEEQTMPTRTPNQVRPKLR